MTELKLADRLAEAIQSGQPGIWVRTHEPEEAMLTLVGLASEDYAPDWELQVWDCIKGLNKADVVDDEKAKNKGGQQIQEQKQSAIAALKMLTHIASEREDREREQKPLEQDSRNVILVLRNGHREITNNCSTQKDVLMQIHYALTLGKSNRCHLVILSFPGVELPVELQEQFWVIDHELPDLKERKEVLEGLVVESGFEVPPNLTELAKAAGGLTRSQVEGVASLSLMHHDEIRASVVNRLKAQTINSRGLLDLDTEWQGRFDGFDTDDEESGETIYVPGLVGLEGLKKFCLGLLDPNKKRRPGKLPPRGVLLVGIPGGGKSAFAKSLGLEVDRPTLSMDIGKMMGGLVGQTEELTREGLDVADAMAPNILFIDEVEKAFAGAKGENDSGVSRRQFGAFLKWMNDHRSEAFVVATANDISDLPPEFLRAGRFSAIFFIGLPTPEQRVAIWDMHMKANRIERPDEMPDDKIWTGAEIATCCDLADEIGCSLVEAAKFVVPTMNTSRETLTRLMEWADGRVLDAESGTMYSKEGVKIPDATIPRKRAHRKVSRKSKS